MRFLDSLRTPPHWLRVLLAACVLSFAFNSIAHAAHEHSDAHTQVIHATCGYCATFGGIVDAPAHTYTSDTVWISQGTARSFVAPVLPLDVITSARARAPPAR